MVNLRYIVPILKTALEKCSGKIVEKLFLTDIDIKFFKDNDCLLSISSEGCYSGQYVVEFDRNQLLMLCN